MRYEHPLAMAEQSAAADLISGGRLQLGISRGSPEQADRGYERFGHVPGPGRDDAAMARAHTAAYLQAIDGHPVSTVPGSGTPVLPVQPQSPGLRERIWWGSGTRQTAEWCALQGMNLMSSTLLSEDTGVSFGELQAEQIDRFRAAWAAAGWEREPRVSVSRSVLPVVSDLDRRLFGDGRGQSDQLGMLEGVIARFGRNYIGEPDVIAAVIAADPAVRAADTLLLTVPNQLGVDYNARMLQTIAEQIAPAIGWQPAA